jgi:hypothetical protein
MTDDTMLNDAMAGTAGGLRLNKTLTEYFLRHSLTAAAKQLAEKVFEGAKGTSQALKLGHIFNDVVARLNRLRKKYLPRRSRTSAAKASSENKPVIAAVNRCATQNQVQHRLFPQAVKSCPSRSWRSPRFSANCKAGPQAKLVITAVKPSTPSRQDAAAWGPRRCATQNLAPIFNLASIFVIATSLCLLWLGAQAQTQNQTQAQTRQQLLQDLDSGQLRDAVLLGQQAVSRWPRDGCATPSLSGRGLLQDRRYKAGSGAAQARRRIEPERLRYAF